MIGRIFAFVLLACGGLSLVALALAKPQLVLQFTDSDKLLIVDWTHRVLVEQNDWRNFQLPRTPSLFPDFLLSVPFQLVTGSWRVAIFAGAAVLLAALLSFAGAIVARSAGTSAADGIMMAWIVSLPLFLLELLLGGAGRHFQVLQPAAHGGSFIVSLAAVLLAERMRTGGGLGWQLLLFLICGLATLSDKLFVFYFDIPLFAALVLASNERRHALMILMSAGLGTIAGLIGFELLPSHQPDIPLDFPRVATRISLFIRDINASIFFGSIAPAVVLSALMPLVLRRHMSARSPLRFFWIFGVTAILSTVALTGLFTYEDRASYRYLAALMWWPVIFAAVILAVRLRHALIFGAAAAICTTALALYSGVNGPGSLWSVTNPDCLATLQLRNGLAGYWHARRTKVFSDWNLNINQINGDGNLYHWGNDPTAYRMDRFGRPSPEFVMMTDLDPAAIATRFGGPSGKIRCGNADVWVYGDHIR